MKRYHVELAPEALAHVEAIHAWWLDHRPASPALFVDEFTAAFELLEHSPRVGRRYLAGPGNEMRRLPLPRTRYLVYYDIDEPGLAVRIHAVWHMSRGQPPPLSSRR